MTVADPTEVAALWMEELGSLTNYVLHDLRNGLQGVAVNLEVIRSRMEQGPEAGSDPRLRPYAVNAAREFEGLAARVEALSYLSRLPSGDADIIAVLEALAKLVGQNISLGVAVETEEAPAAVTPAAARLLLTHAVLAGVNGGSPVQCVVVSTMPVTVRIHCECDTGRLLDPEVERVAEVLHVNIEKQERELTLTFPTLAQDDTVFV